MPLCRALLAAALDKRSSKALALFCLGEVAASACVCGEGEAEDGPRSHLPPWPFLVVCGGGCRRCRRGGAIGSPGSAWSEKTRSRAGTYVHNLRLSRDAPAVTLLLPCSWPKPRSQYPCPRRRRAAAAATSAFFLFLWSATPNAYSCYSRERTWVFLARVRMRREQGA